MRAQSDRGAMDRLVLADPVGRVVARAVAGRTLPLSAALVIGESARVERIRDKLASSRAHARSWSRPCRLVGEECRGRRLGRDCRGVPSCRRRAERPPDHHRPDDDRHDRRRRSDSDREGQSASESGVAPDVRGGRVRGRVRRRRRHDDARRSPLRAVRSSRLLKRAFDVARRVASRWSSSSPVLAAIALAIRLDSGGPIFFRQVRVGRDGKHFRIFKFRSMVVDADARKDELRSLNEAGNGLFKITNDPRITRVGRFLRRTSLDELPQVFNVLRGEMSLVGPRPLVVDEDAQVLGPRSQPSASDTGHDRALAGLGLSGTDAGDGRDRLSVRGQLVALARPQGPGRTSSATSPAAATSEGPAATAGPVYGVRDRVRTDVRPTVLMIR